MERGERKLSLEGQVDENEAPRHDEFPFPDETGSFDWRHTIEHFKPLSEREKESDNYYYYLGSEYHRQMREDGFFRIVWVKPVNRPDEKKGKNLLCASWGTSQPNDPRRKLHDCCVFLHGRWMSTKLYLANAIPSSERYECKELDQRGEWRRFAVRVASADEVARIRPLDAETGAPSFECPDLSDPSLPDAFTTGFHPQETVFGSTWHHHIRSGTKFPTVHVWLAGKGLGDKGRMCTCIAHVSHRVARPCAFPLNGRWWQTVVFVTDKRASCCSRGFYEFKVPASFIIFLTADLSSNFFNREPVPMISGLH